MQAHMKEPIDKNDKDLAVIVSDLAFVLLDFSQGIRGIIFDICNTGQVPSIILDTNNQEAILSASRKIATEVRKLTPKEQLFVLKSVREVDPPSEEEILYNEQQQGVLKAIVTRFREKESLTLSEIHMAKSIGMGDTETATDVLDMDNGDKILELATTFKVFFQYGIDYQCPLYCGDF